jgi:hypothetical protein
MLRSARLAIAYTASGAVTRVRSIPHGPGARAFPAPLPSKNNDHAVRAEPVYKRGLSHDAADIGIREKRSIEHCVRRSPHHFSGVHM